MWNLLEKNDKECRKLRDLLEDSALARPEAARIEELSETWAAAEHNHLAACNRCQTAAQDLLATRKIFKGVGSATEMARPWFSTRVMAAIAARQRELTEAAGTGVAGPEFASRVKLALGGLLLFSGTWVDCRALHFLNQRIKTFEAAECP